MSVSRISTEAVSICGIRRRKSLLFSSSIAEAGDRTATRSWDSCKKSRDSLSSWATRSSPSALINPKNWLRPRTNRPPPTPWFPTVTRPGSRGSASPIVWMISLSIPTRISTRSTWKNIPAPSTISYRRPLCLLSVEKARSFSSTSILITKCDCTRRFFWRRPRPMPRNDPEVVGESPKLFHQAVVKFFRPLATQELFDCFAPLEKLCAVTPIVARSWRRSRRAYSRSQVAQARDVPVEKDAMNAIVRHGEQERCEWLVLVVEDERRLAIELVYFELQGRAAGRRRDKGGDLSGALERRLKVANGPATPAFGPAVRDHHRVVRQHGDERVKIPRGCGLRERRE